MTRHNHVQSHGAREPEGSLAGYSIVLGQETGTAVVRVRGEREEEALAKLEAILADVVDLQANLAVAVAGDATAVPLPSPSARRSFVAPLTGPTSEGHLHGAGTIGTRVPAPCR